MWLVVVFLAGHLAGALAWLTVSTEEAPDLLATAPVRRRDVLWAKLQAALVPTAVIAAGPVALAWSMNAWLGFTVLLCSAGSALSTSLLHVRYPSTAKRSELAWRGASNKVLPFVEMLLGLTWGRTRFAHASVGLVGNAAARLRRSRRLLHDAMMDHARQNCKQRCPQHHR